MIEFRQAQSLMYTLAQRTQHIQAFHVMEMVKQAAMLEQQGAAMIHLDIGEPDFSAPPMVLEAAKRALEQGATQYTAALGLWPLRCAIADFYRSRYKVLVAPQRIVVTAGASGALLLTLAALINPGDEVLMPDPCYPCNRNLLALFHGRAKLIPADAAQRFQLSAAAVQAHWSAATRGVLLASPSNPTGTSIAFAELQKIIASVRARNGFTIVDEIYQGLTYDQPPRTALECGEDVLVINSFSKYFSMTGWRLGWLVVPPALVSSIEKLAQNLYICASTLAQHAGLACFTPPALEIFEQRRLELKGRRDYIVPALAELGFAVPLIPDGAFYVYIDCSRFSTDSEQFAHEILQKTGVVLVPGKDFGEHDPKRWLRLSYANSLDNLREGVRRLRDFLKGN